MRAHHGRRVTAIRPRQAFESAVANAYDLAGDQYIAYADGDPRKLFVFDGHYAYGDRCIWEVIDSALVALRGTGAESVRVLDIGCGPGTWLRRVVTRARALGFCTIAARGFDIASAQVRRARELAQELRSLSGVSLNFETGDILAPFAEADGSIDLCLCLCGVLNHLPATALPNIFARIARVTEGTFITTARAIGSTPSVYVDGIEQARRFRQDNRNNRLEVEFQNGRHVSLPSHLFAASELRGIVSPHLAIKDLRGLDLFHGRFAGDPRWNVECGVNGSFAGALRVLENTYCRDPEFIDHATHLLLVGSGRATCAARGRFERPLDNDAKSVAPAIQARGGHHG